MKHKVIGVMIVLVILLALFGPVIAAQTPVGGVIPVLNLKGPNVTGKVRCVTQDLDEVIVDFTGDGVDVTCRVYVRESDDEE